MAGRDTLLIVMRPVASVDPETGAKVVGRFNEPAAPLVDQGPIWARVKDLSDVEAVAAGQEASARMSQFTVRANALSDGITSDDVLRHDATGRTWKVTGKIDSNIGRRRAYVVTGIQRSDGERDA